MTALPDPWTAVKCALVVEAARSFGEVRLRVGGISMLPSVWPGDVLIVRRCAFSEIRPGQIVFQYAREGLFIAHRVVGNRGGHLLTRGDRHAHDDAPVSEDQILGRVVSIERNGRLVDPAFTPVRRVAAWFLRRSDLLVRVLLHTAARPGL